MSSSFDPFDVRMQLLSHLKKLNASQQSIQKVVQFAIKYGARCGEDLWDCMIEECEKVSTIAPSSDGGQRSRESGWASSPGEGTDDPVCSFRRAINALRWLSREARTTCMPWSACRLPIIASLALWERRRTQTDELVSSTGPPSLPSSHLRPYALVQAGAGVYVWPHLPYICADYQLWVGSLQGTLNVRINVLFLLDSLCETSLYVGLPDAPYVDYVTRDLARIVELVVPETREGVLNLLSAKQVRPQLGPPGSTSRPVDGLTELTFAVICI